MKVFEVTISIQATPQAVWAVLTDGAHWTQWNPTVDRVEGNIAAGERLTVHAKLSPGRAFPVKVSAFEPPSRMVWTGGMPLGLFKGERTSTISSRSSPPTTMSATASASPTSRSAICS